MNNNYKLTPHTYMFNYFTGQIKPLDPNKNWDNRWRAVTSVVYPFPVDDVKKHVPNAEKVFVYDFSHKSNFGEHPKHDFFWGYVVVRNSETRFLDSVTFLNKNKDE